MRNKPKICINCRYFEMNANPGKDYCYAWESEIGALVRTYGCEKYEPNLHDNNAARSEPEARDKGIHQEE